ncbi:MAG: copper chaperone PCu(A)C [Armatimonadetes bacterium]|nr:copper chaperone PCu(A)C [Armatimonadota bacterium]MDW8154743.1 copper chaperone PCu(A)C [Armatimonadota bacterium]
MRTVAVLVALGLAVGLAQAQQTPVEIKNPWARPGNRGGNSAVYLEIRNHQPHPDRLVAAGTDVAEAVELHETRTEGGMHRMQRVGSIEVPANGQVALRPGGLHVMLIRLNTDLRVGDRFPLILRFERAGRIIAEVVVREQSAGGEHR